MGVGWWGSETLQTTLGTSAILKPNYNSMDFLEMEVLQDNLLVRSPSFLPAPHHTTRAPLVGMG